MARKLWPLWARLLLIGGCVAFIAAIVLVAAHRPRTNRVGNTCGSDGDCGDAEHCVGDLCTKECDSDADCPGQWTCRDDVALKEDLFSSNTARVCWGERGGAYLPAPGAKVSPATKRRADLVFVDPGEANPKAAGADATAILAIDNPSAAPVAVAVASDAIDGKVDVPPDGQRLIALWRKSNEGASVQVTITGAADTVVRTIDLGGKGDLGVFVWSQGGEFDYETDTQTYGQAYVAGSSLPQHFRAREIFHVDGVEFPFAPLPDKLEVTDTAAAVGTASATSLTRDGDRHDGRCHHAGGAIVCSDGEIVSYDAGPGWPSATTHVVVDWAGRGAAQLSIDGHPVADLEPGKLRRIEMAAGDHELAVAIADAAIDRVQATLAADGTYVFNPGGRNDYKLEEEDVTSHKWEKPERNPGMWRDACACGLHFFETTASYVLDPASADALGDPTRLVHGRAGEVVVPARALAEAKKRADRVPAADRAAIEQAIAAVDPATATLCDVSRIRRMIGAASGDEEDGMEDFDPCAARSAK